ncbi:MAG: STAS domain-containing protein [Candidatus Eremiobacteraeota bacterium]|nr:STAS domain-containing protein [Candidatus Eremiobacteraeota bacterium]
MLLELSGDLDLAVKEQLRQQLDAASLGSSEVAVDLSKVDYADSTALGLLVGTRNRLRERGGRLILVAPSTHMLKLLEYAGLASTFDTVDNYIASSS